MKQFVFAIQQNITPCSQKKLEPTSHAYQARQSIKWPKNAQKKLRGGLLCQQSLSPRSEIWNPRLALQQQKYLKTRNSVSWRDFSIRPVMTTWVLSTTSRKVLTWQEHYRDQEFSIRSSVRPVWPAKTSGKFQTSVVTSSCIQCKALETKRLISAFSQPPWKEVEKGFIKGPIKPCGGVTDPIFLGASLFSCGPASKFSTCYEPNWPSKFESFFFGKCKKMRVWASFVRLSLFSSFSWTLLRAGLCQ